MNEGRQFRARREILMRGLADLGVFLRDLLFENGHCAQGEQPDHRADLQAFGLTVRQAQDIVKEAVLLIPHAGVLTRTNHPRSDHEDVFDEFHRETDIARIVHCQFCADLDHILAEKRHPGGAVGLFQVSAGRQRRRSIEDPDIIQPQKAPFEGIVSGPIFAVHPPDEIRMQLKETAFEPGEVALSTLLSLGQVGVDR